MAYLRFSYNLTFLKLTVCPLMTALVVFVPCVTMVIFLPLMGTLSAVVPCVAMRIFSSL